MKNWKVGWIVAGGLLVIMLVIFLAPKKQSTRPEPQVQAEKKSAEKAKKVAKPASKPKPATPQPQVQQAPKPTVSVIIEPSSPPQTPPPAPASAPTPGTPPPKRTVNILSGNSLSINILSSVGEGWRSGVAVNGYGWGGPTRWVPGSQRLVTEDRPEGRVSYWTWEPAHYE